MKDETKISIIALVMVIPALYGLYATKAGTDYQLSLSIFIYAVVNIIGLLYFLKYRFMDKRLALLSILSILIFTTAYFYASYSDRSLY